MDLSQAQIAQLQDVGVTLVYLFGSSAEETSFPWSDVDLGVILTNAPSPGVYQQLYDLFTDLFPGRTVDIVWLQRASLELRGDAVRHGLVLYEVSPDARAAFEERTMLACADFAPLQREIDRTILART